MEVEGACHDDEPCRKVPEEGEAALGAQRPRAQRGRSFAAAAAAGGTNGPEGGVRGLALGLSLCLEAPQQSFAADRRQDPACPR